MKTKIRTHHNQPGIQSLLLLATFLGTALCTLVARADSWTTKAPMPTPRRHATSGVIDDKLYTASGLVQSGGGSPVLEVYDPASDTWSTKRPMPISRYGAGGAVVGGKLFVIGGHDYYPDSAVVAYDPVTDTWATKSPMPLALGDVKAAAIDDKIYVEGVDYGGTYHFLIYSPATDNWTHKMTVPRYPPTNFGGESSVAAIGGKFYAAGGLVSGQLSGLTVLRVYDPVGDTWTLRASMPSSRMYARGAALNGHFYVIGGYLPGVGGPFASVFEYDAASDSWATKTPMQTARAGFALGVIGGNIYVSGGETPGGIIGSTEVYTPDTTSNPEPNPCEAELASAQQQIQNLQDQLATADGTIQNLTQANQALAIQNGLLQSQVNALTGQNAQLQAANAQLVTQLNAANQTIQDQQNQIAQLLAQLNVVGQQVQNLAQSFQALFNDPQFQIPGATPAQQIANLLAGIGNLNHGQKQALYVNLGGKPGKGK